MNKDYNLGKNSTRVIQTPPIPKTKILTMNDPLKKSTFTSPYPSLPQNYNTKKVIKSFVVEKKKIKKEENKYIDNKKCTTTSDKQQPKALSHQLVDKDKPQLIKTRNTIGWLCDRFPDCFNYKNIRPLKQLIHKDIISSLSPEDEVTKMDIMRALTCYTRHGAYLKSIIAQDHRIDLQGQPAGDVEESHKTYAMEIKETRKKKKIEEKEKQACL